MEVIINPTGRQHLQSFKVLDTFAFVFNLLPLSQFELQMQQSTLFQAAAADTEFPGNAYFWTCSRVTHQMQHAGSRVLLPHTAFLQWCDKNKTRLPSTASHSAETRGKRSALETKGPATAPPTHTHTHVCLLICKSLTQAGTVRGNDFIKSWGELLQQSSLRLLLINHNYQKRKSLWIPSYNK